MEKRGWVREEGRGLDSGDGVVVVVGVVVADMHTLVGGVEVDDDGVDYVVDVVVAAAVAVVAVGDLH